MEVLCLCNKHSINIGLSICDFLFAGGDYKHFFLFFGKEWASEGTWRRHEKPFRLLITWELLGTSDNYNELIYLQRIRDLGMVQFFHFMFHISLGQVI